MVTLIFLISIVFLCINIHKILPSDRVLRAGSSSPSSTESIGIIIYTKISSLMTRDPESTKALKGFKAEKKIYLAYAVARIKFSYRMILFIILIYKIINIFPLLALIIKILFFFLLALTFFNELIIFIIVYCPSIVVLCMLKLKSRKVCIRLKVERANKLNNYYNKKLHKIFSIFFNYKNLVAHFIFILKKNRIFEYFIFFISYAYGGAYALKFLKLIYIISTYLFGIDLLLYFNFSNYFSPYAKIIAYSLKFSFSGIDSNTNSNTNTNTNIFNFNTLSLNEQYEYIKLKFFNKAIEPNIPFLDWFIQLLVNTDGSQHNVDQIIETNLNKIQKIERDAQLNSHSFSRVRPFLINKTDTSSTQMPNIVPYKNNSYYDD